MAVNAGFGHVYTSRVQDSVNSGKGVFDPEKIHFEEDENGKVFIDGVRCRVIGNGHTDTEQPDPYNPLGLPPLTLRVKWQSGYTPDIGDTKTLVDATDNIWDITMANGNWNNKFFNPPNVARVIEVIGANTKDVTDIRGCFRSCSRITTVCTMDLSGCTQYGTDNMFNGCTKLVSIGALKMDGVPSANSMFYRCTKMVTSPVLNGTSSLTSTKAMFRECSKLTDVTLFDTSSVVNFGTYNSANDGMFNGCSALTYTPIFRMDSAVDLGAMFYGCTALTTISSDLDVSNAKYLTRMFNGCNKLAAVPNNWDLSGAEQLDYMFYGCKALTSVGSLITSSAVNTSGMFATCSALVSAPAMDLTHCTDTTYMFGGDTVLTSVPLYSMGSVQSAGGMFSSCTALETLPAFDTHSVTTFWNSNRGGFAMSCTALKAVPLLDTSSATDMRGMFSGCTALKAVPLLNTSSANLMGAMFANCTAVESGALALYQQASTQTTPPTNSANCFLNCGASADPSAPIHAEMAQIPTDWGGTMA